MPNASFKDLVLDQLRAIPELRAKAMFAGGHGLYSGEKLFGILHASRLYFKVDDASRPEYVSRNMGLFTYEQRGRVLTMPYHEVPSDVLKNTSELVLWAKRAIEVV